MVQIKGENLSIGYEGGYVVKNINFEVKSGEYICIVGENGAGKTTLLKTLLGLKPILSGKVETESNMKIGYLPQQTSIQRDFPATVKEIVLTGYLNTMGLRPFYTKKEKSKALLSIKKMGIIHLKNTCYRELSGGQQQRVLLARALCATGEMLFLDEPIKGLDKDSTEEMYKIIEKINKKGTTVMMVSHDVETMLTKATHVLHIGKENFFGTVKEYKKSEIGMNYLKLEPSDDLKSEANTHINL